MYSKYLEMILNDILMSLEDNAPNGSGFGLEITKLCMNE